MTWTIADDEPDIHVRAIINANTHQNELRDLIAALQKRLTKETTDAGPTVRHAPGDAAQKAAQEAHEAARTDDEA